MILLIAWRNIWRNKIRSAVVIGSVMIGLWAGIFIMAFFRGLTNEQIETSISQQYSHLQVHHPRFRELDESIYTIENPREVTNLLQQEPAVKATSGRILLTAMAASAYTFSGITLLGVDPTRETEVTGLAGRIRTGRYFIAGKPGQVLVGEKLLKKLKLQVDSKLVLTFQDAGTELVAAAFRITGVFTAASSAVEENLVYVNRAELDSMAGLRGGIHEIAILLRDNDRLENTASALRTRLPNLALETWKQISPELRVMIDSFAEYMVIIISILLVALVFGIVNTMLMAVLERQRELGVLMAVGLNKKKVFTMILTETIGMTLLGCLAGLPIAWLTVELTRKNGIDLSKFAEGLAMYGYGNIVRPELELVYYWQVAGMALVAAILAAIYPAYKALQLQPAVAIRKI